MINLRYFEIIVRVGVVACAILVALGIVGQLYFTVTVGNLCVPTSMLQCSMSWVFGLTFIVLSALLVKVIVQQPYLSEIK